MSQYRIGTCSYKLSLPPLANGRSGAGKPGEGPQPGAGRAAKAGLPQELRLADVWSMVVGKGGVLVGKEAADGLLSSFDDLLLPIDAAWRHSISNPRPYVAELRNVVVVPGTRILLDGDGRALSDEIEDAYRNFSLRPKVWDVEISDGPFLRFKSLPPLGEVIPDGIHLTGEHEANYFHWVAEILPRIYLYERLTGEKELPLLVSDGLHENLYRLLRIVCGSERETIRLKPGRCVAVGRLVYPSDVNRVLDFYDRPPSHETTYLSVGLLKDMVKAIRAALPSSGDDGGKRIFLRRCATYRRLLNDDEVEKFLVARGFVSVDPGVLSIEQQIALFSSADMVVGPSGAAMTNILWCPSHARVLVLHPDHPFKKYPYWDALARVADARISYLPGPRAHNVEGLFEVHDDYRIPVESLRAALTDLERSSGEQVRPAPLRADAANSGAE